MFFLGGGVMFMSREALSFFSIFADVFISMDMFLGTCLLYVSMHTLALPESSLKNAGDF